MGLIRSFRNDLSISDPKAWNPSLWNLSGNQSLSGETVTEETALTYSAIWNAVTLYSSISTLPLHLLRMDDSKTLHAKDNKLYRVLHDKFNPWMTAQIGREVSLAHLLLWGNSYAEIVRDGRGDVAELWPIAPNRVRPFIEGKELWYEIDVGTEKVILPRKKILHIPGLGFDGVVGYSVVGMARKSIGLGMALETFGATYFGQGTHPGAIVTHPSQLSPTAHSNLKSDLTEKYSGLGQSHRLMLLDEGMKIEHLGIPPNDSQFLESRQFHITEVARWFNLPVHKLKEMTKSSLNNIESEQLSYVIDSLMPVIIRYESNYNMQLLSENELYKHEMFTRHNVDGLLRGNVEARAKYYQMMWGIGALSINQILAKENMDPSDQEFADDKFVPLNMVPLTMLRENLEKSNRAETISTQQIDEPVDPAKQLKFIREMIKQPAGATK